MQQNADNLKITKEVNELVHIYCQQHGTWFLLKLIEMFWIFA